MLGLSFILSARQPATFCWGTDCLPCLTRRFFCQASSILFMRNLSYQFGPIPYYFCQTFSVSLLRNWGILRSFCQTIRLILLRNCYQIPREMSTSIVIIFIYSPFMLHKFLFNFLQLYYLFIIFYINMVYRITRNKENCKTEEGLLPHRMHSVESIFTRVEDYGTIRQ